MEGARGHNRWLIAVLFLLGFVLAVFPLPVEWRWLRPEFIAILVIYWITVMPQQFGAGLAWCVGILQDVIEGVVLGEHALALVLVAYVCQLSYQRIRSYAVWQQSAWVFVLVGIHQLFGNWVHSLLGYSAPPLLFLSPAFMSALLWPVAILLFERLRTAYRVA